MRLVLLGPPGAGKGTQAERLSGSLGLPHISTGAILRANIREDTPLGRRAKHHVESGEHVPDAMIVEIVLDRLGDPDCVRGFLLDGFPRTTSQAEALDRWLMDRGLGLDGVLWLDVDDEEILQRLGGRLVCDRCELAFQLNARPPRSAGACDRCGAALHRRTDDDPETILRRLAASRVEALELLTYYRQRGLLHEVRGSGPISKITEAIDVLRGSSGI